MQSGGQRQLARQAPRKTVSSAGIANSASSTGIALGLNGPSKIDVLVFNAAARVHQLQNCAAEFSAVGAIWSQDNSADAFDEPLEMRFLRLPDEVELSADHVVRLVLQLEQVIGALVPHLEQLLLVVDAANLP